MTPPPLALFQKFVRFGSGILPYENCLIEGAIFISLSIQIDWDMRYQNKNTYENSQGAHIFEHVLAFVYLNHTNYRVRSQSCGDICFKKKQICKP